MCSIPPVPSLLLAAAAGWTDVLFERFNYVGPFLVLLLCGLGLPLPEEVTLIGSGVLLYHGQVAFAPITVVCAIAILLGDSIPYWLGRRYGPEALNVRWVRRVLHPERFALIEQRFAEHGNWVVFTCRFLPGIRLPGYFTAGTLGMRYWRFMLLDALGVLISVPTSIWLAKLGASHVQERMKGLHLLLAFILVSVLLMVLVRARVRRRTLQVERLQVAERAETAAAPRTAPEGRAGGEIPAGRQ